MSNKDLRLLVLNGGWIHDLSSLEMLGELMQEDDPKHPPKPCNYFDIIGGTSTGGFIA